MSPTVRAFLTLFSVLAGVSSASLYVWLAWRLDRYEKEPPSWLAAAFLWGAVPAIAASAIVEIAFGVPVAAISGSWDGLVSASLVAPLVEEFFKALSLWLLFRVARHEFDDVLDGIVYGAMVGFGFAMTENIAYFLGARDTADVASWGLVVLGRSVAFGFNHAMFTSLTGVGFGLARFARSRRQRAIWIISGLAAAMLAHSTHNFFLHAGDLCVLSFAADWLGVLGVLAIALIAWNRERTWIETELADEIDTGVLTPELYAAICTRRQRGRPLLPSSAASADQTRSWRRLVQAATELAFKKHQQTAMANLEDHSQRIIALRISLLTHRQALGDRLAMGQVACRSCGRPLRPTDALCSYCGESRPSSV